MAKTISRPRPRKPSARVARALLLRIREIGGDTPQLLRKAGITSTAADIFKPSWNGPLSADQFTSLYRECVVLLEAYDSHRQGRPPMTKAEVDMLCYCVITCATLEEAIGRAGAFCAMLGARAAELSLAVEGAVAAFRMHTIRRRREVAGFLSDLTGLSTYHRLFSWLIGEEIELLGVEVSYPQLMEEDVSARIMPHPLIFDREANLLRFPAHYLGRPVVRSYAELVELLKRFPFDLETIQSKSMPFSERVRTTFRTALVQRMALPSLDTLARQFNVSGASLKRRLAEEGTSLRRLRDDSRHDQALDLLSDPTMTLGEIAQRLGFSEASAFSRAFKAWSGLAPQAFRDRPLADGHGLS